MGDFLFRSFVFLWRTLHRLLQLASILSLLYWVSLLLFLMLSGKEHEWSDAEIIVFGLYLIIVPFVSALLWRMSERFRIEE